MMSFTKIAIIFTLPGCLSAADLTLAQLVDRVTAQERKVLEALPRYTPVVETYIQEMAPDPELESAPKTDHYFIRRLDLSQGIKEDSFLKRPSLRERVKKEIQQINSLHFISLGFSATISPSGAQRFDRNNYEFEFSRREFLGEIRCVVLNVKPRVQGKQPMFLGQIWVEDQGYNIVRFNGVFTPNRRLQYFFHLDSWRMEVQPGLWLPAYIYTEESKVPINLGLKHAAFKAQTRLWGYSTRTSGNRDDFAQIVLADSKAMPDAGAPGSDRSPIESVRSWERQAEDNVIRRLEKDALLSPQGSVDKVLDTVVNNLQATNDLDIQPDVRCRVLLTTPIESFSVGHTIVISRGLIDVVPDEATLALLLAHELAHIALGHGVDAKYAFSDRLMFEESGALRHLNFHRDRKQEEAADAKAMELIAKSPYGKNLEKAGLFLRALASRGPKLPSLLQPLLGSELARGHSLVRMAEVAERAPALQPREVKQVAALPLGSRIKLDPWSGELKLMKTQQSTLLSPREKMSFEITPVIFNLSRTVVSGAAVRGQQELAAH